MPILLSNSLSKRSSIILCWPGRGDVHAMRCPRASALESVTSPRILLFSCPTRHPSGIGRMSLKKEKKFVSVAILTLIFSNLLERGGTCRPLQTASFCSGLPCSASSPWGRWEGLLGYDLHPFADSTAATLAFHCLWTSQFPPLLLLRSGGGTISCDASC